MQPSGSEWRSQRLRGIEGRHRGELDDVDESELDNGDETTDLNVLTGSESGLAVGNAGSGDGTTHGDCGDGDENDFDDGEDVVGSGEFEGRMSGLGLCESESEDRVWLGSCDGQLGAIGGGPVASGDELELSSGWRESVGTGRGDCDEAEKCEKAQLGVSNEVRKSGEVELEDPEGLVGV